MTKERIKRFVKEHKIDIISAGTVILGGTLCAVGINFAYKGSSNKVIDMDMSLIFSKISVMGTGLKSPSGMVITTS